MELTLWEYIEQLNNIKEELKDKPVYIEAPNGLLFNPKNKFKTKDSLLDLTDENVDSIIICYD